jgi:purine-binding chemotaxis protein CheW
MPSSDQPALGACLLGEIKSSRPAEDAPAAAEEWVKVVLVRAGSGRYAFLGRDIREILSGSELYWVPGLPDFLPGLIHVRGDIESVIDVQRLLGQPGAGAGASPRLIVMAVRKDFRSGILVDEVEDVVDVPRSAIQPPLITLEESIRDLIAGEIRLEGRLIPLLDLERLQARVTL